MPSPEDIHEQQKRLAIHRSMLAHHLKQEAIQGMTNIATGPTDKLRGRQK